METMEEKLGAILNNPQMMQQIMSMAQTLNVPQEQSNPKPPAPASDFDPVMLHKIMSLAGNLSADTNQQALLRALQPYLSGDRIRKLEKAMRAAKLASAASTVFGNGGLSFLTGR